MNRMGYRRRCDRSCQVSGQRSEQEGSRCMSRARAVPTPDSPTARGDAVPPHALAGRRDPAGPVHSGLAEGLENQPGVRCPPARRLARGTREPGPTSPRRHRRGDRRKPWLGRRPIYRATPESPGDTVAFQLAAAVSTEAVRAGRLTSPNCPGREASPGRREPRNNLRPRRRVGDTPSARLSSDWTLVGVG